MLEKVIIGERMQYAKNMAPTMLDCKHMLTILDVNYNKHPVF
jgi:hypothetical protein